MKDLAREKEKRNVSIVKDVDGASIVIINDIRFKGKSWDEWEAIKEYLKQYIGECYPIIKTSETIYIGEDFPDEFIGSEYTAHLWEEKKRAKANIIQGIPELIQTADRGIVSPNKKAKHSVDAGCGWSVHRTRFALPKYERIQENYILTGYKLYQADLLVRRESADTLWLYDIINISRYSTSNE